MSHLEKDILKGKFGKNKSLKREAREELIEVKGKRRGKAMANALEMKRRKAVSSEYQSGALERASGQQRGHRSFTE